MHFLTTIKAAFWFHWLTFGRNREQHFMLLQSVPTAVLFAYIASVSDRPVAQAYIFFGALFLLAWSNTVFRVGWTLSDELWTGTLDLSLVSRAPTYAVIIGRSLAILSVGLIAGVFGVITVSLFTGELPPADNVAFLAGSLLVAAISLLAVSIILSPIALLVDARAGFFNGIIAPGLMLSGLLYPATRLPDGLDLIARALPTSWAMEAVVDSAQGAAVGEILEGWLGALLLGAIFLLAAKLFVDVVQRRIILTGELGRS